MSIPEFDEIVEPNDQTAARKEHLDALLVLVGNVYPNRFDRSSLSGGEDTITRLLTFDPVVEAGDEMASIKASLKEGERPPAEVKDKLNERLKALGTVRTAGRLTTPPRGNFVHLTDGIGKLQIYCDKKGGFGVIKNDGTDILDIENGWTAWKLIDHGDFVGVEGYLFVTNTGEVSVHVEKLQFLSKAMLPMPDKMHGIADPEIRQRQRYADLIASSLQVEHEGLTTREVFETRAKVISSLRRSLEDDGYIEVETPMLTPKATGAAATPFETHHNALDITLYARIAPELYLKRLVVGGFEKVYELNRNFRNEGISYKHNPEFTMLEFYCAYMDVEGMMNFCEELLRESVRKAANGLIVNYEEQEIDFSNFRRLPMKDAVIEFWEQEWRTLGGVSISRAWLEDANLMRRLKLFRRIIELECRRASERYYAGLSPEEAIQEARRQYEQTAIDKRDESWQKAGHLLASVFGGLEVEDKDFEQMIGELQKERDKGLLLQDLFEMVAERHLVQPTFIIDFPKSISPLSKASPENPAIAERFELFINGMEVANGFSELNDPKEQYERFVDQMAERERGDDEAMVLDEDYIRALSYGMPPAAGIGIGIDRLVMLLTNKHSIRDVILFPHLRPERHAPAGENTNEEN